MRISIILLAVGVLFLLAVIALLCLKKLPLRWGVSLILCAAILCGGGTVFLRREQAQRRENYGSIYMALRYLENGRTDPAALYLRRTTLRNDYHLLAAQVLLEQLRGNDAMVQVRMNLLENSSRLSSAQEDGVAALQVWSPEKEKSLRNTVDTLIELLPLKAKDMEQLDRRFEMELGVEDWDGDTADDAEKLRFRINQAVGAQKWDEALSAAVELVHLSPNAEDRLLLASVIAEVTYSGIEMKTRQFAAYETGSYKDTGAEERETLEKEYERLQRRLEALQIDLANADEKETPALMQQEKELSGQVEEMQLQAAHIFAYRALNSIADIHTLEAQIVRAKLYFAIRSYQQAIDQLCDAADSLQARLSGSRQVRDSLQTLKKLYETEGSIGADSDDFRAGMQVLLGSAHPELLNFSFTPLTDAFVKRISDDQKSYGDTLYIMDFDTEKFPQITVRLGGEKRVIQRLAEQKGLTVNDTQLPAADCQVTVDEGEGVINSICFAVDISGSMSGSPLTDAQEALHTFLDETDDYTELALTVFDDSAETRVPLSSSISALTGGIDALYADGGTDITAGILEGTAALQQARGGKTLLLMTDGQSSIDMQAVENAAAEGIVIFTIGFGDVNDELLRQIAEATGGQYVRADSSEELSGVYRSLRGVIGNTATLTYTVSDPAEDSRYFFLREGDSGVSVRREYTVQPAEAEEPVQADVDYRPVLESREALDSALQWQQDTFTVYLNGTKLEDVTAAAFGSNACTISYQRDTALRLEVPASIADGCYDLTLTLADGTVLTVPKMLWIGSEMSCRTCLAGSLDIWADTALLMPDQSLVLGSSVRIKDRPAEETMSQTLDMTLDGVLVFEGVPLPDDGSGTLTLVAGSAAGYGTASLNYGDAAYTGSNRTLCSGEMTLDYSQGPCTIRPSEVKDS